MIITTGVPDELPPPCEERFRGAAPLTLVPQ
jgi:hypothetical protein